MKTKFVKGYHRGLELYGQHASRLKDRKIEDSLSQHGLVIVEGPNDVMRLDCLGIAAVGLCSDKATGEQVEKICRFAKQVAKGRVSLMLDRDEEGEAGAKELLWRLSQWDGTISSVGWSDGPNGTALPIIQPEELNAEIASAVFAEGDR